MSACSRVPCEGYYPWPELIESPNQHFPGYAPGRFDRFTLCNEAILSTYENRFLTPGELIPSQLPARLC